ncbi:disease resistance protein RPV1-like [Vitis riparia]|uniref:disease resistance protein RPV1-like n=1 Tax=Vitis riparia TaxID=96939 RepID=UPI00155AE956|nr:disease resistance protein RPV1-like [Vitis riparia]XP_034679887.1 disease resistance protein RPV1-like [Vitis riparia]XP_034679888.1 disease resistance protein RPV1-like [Vitis riparia]
MASTSNSKRPFCSSSSSNFKWRYDVFLSFRGEDTRKNFISHLYLALDNANIKTFKDDEELRKGEEIAPELLKAIEESRIAIIVFSKTYAHSKWCLDELVKIMECKEEKGQIVLPIFYHVQPCEVRNQYGTYGEEFKKHESKADKEKKKKIEKWRTALRKAGDLSGFNLKDRSEAKFIEEIIGEIRRLIPKWVHVGENIVGMDEKLKEVKLLIDARSNKVSMVGIYGTGGIGKTTIAKVVYNDMLDQFKRHSFLENVREKSKDDRGLLELQKKLLCDILMKKDLKLSNIGEGIQTIKSKCCSEKVLIVLDDVDREGQLKFLAPNSDCFHQGSIIIVTTRNKRCLDVYDSYSSYEAKGLAHEQAKELFCLNAFPKHHPKDNYVDLSNRILDYAKGLPLALVVLGSSLLERDVDEWESTLDELKTIPPEDILKVLQISYDGLSDERKKLFLYIACFFKDEDEKMATRILESCKLHPAIGLRVLHERCLISIEDNTIRMHDLLQEMGWAIVCNDPERPRKWSRLCELQDIENVLPQNEWTKNIEGIFTRQSRHTGKHIQLTTEVFRNMNQLRLLKVEVKFNQIVQLSQDFELPCHDLVYFHWDRYPLESLPSNFDADNLVELNLRFSKIKHFWEGNMPAKKLKVIDLSDSDDLVDISSISSMPNLEILILEGCLRLTSLPRNLHMLECLQTLSCCGCSNLESFPEIEEEMRSLRKLNLSATGITKLPSSIRHLNGLEDLYLSYCKNLSTLPDSISSLSSLQALNLSLCSKLKSLPRNLHKLKCLQTLSCDYCSNLESFPEIEEEMRSLRKLNLSYTGITELPSSIRHLNGLEHLDLSSCNNLLSLPDSISSLSSLRTLSLKFCSKLKDFAYINIGSLKALKFFDLSWCENLESLPNSIGSLSSLQTLLLRRCSKLKSFPDINIGSLKALESLDFFGCRNLESLPESIYNLSSLKTLQINGCPKLKEMLEIKLAVCSRTWQFAPLTCHISNSAIIWDYGRHNYFSLLEALDPRCPLSSSLEELSVRKFFGMEEHILSGSFHLSSLQILSLGSFPRVVEGFLDDIFHLSSLVELYLTKCKPKEEGIPSDIWNLSPLQKLSPRDCNLMEGKILKHICHLTSLEVLHLGWNHFSSIPAGRSRLSNLKALDLSDCKNLLQLPELPSSLRVLDAHCSDGISSSPSLLPIHSMVNCFKSEIEDRKVINHYSYFSGNGIGIFIPRSSGILEWITYRNMGRDEVTIELPPNWYENDDLWGFALCCVYVAPAYESQYESGLISEDDSELEDEEPVFCCELTIEGNNQLENVGFFSFFSPCVPSDVSDMQWVICYPKLAIKKSYHTNQWTHFKASFGGAQVEECGIRLVYRKDYEQKHPTMAQGSTSHGNFGEHGSVREDTDSKAHNKRNPTEQSPREESHHKRSRETQD